MVFVYTYIMVALEPRYRKGRVYMTRKKKNEKKM